MDRRSVRIALALALCVTGAAPVWAGLTPGDLRCEYQAGPLAIDSPRPRLSWVLSGAPGERGQVQTAYQVLVAASPEALAADKGDLWDSGRVASDRTSHVEYAGKPPASRAACYWKVRAWDGEGRPSAWSTPAAWAMGLLAPEDWKGRWIGAPLFKGAPERPGYLPAVFLRKPFTLAGPVKRAVVYATAAGVYELHLNGRRVGEDYFAPGWTNYDKRLYYQAYDVTGLLRSGENVIGAIVGDGWYGLHHGGRGRLAMLGQLHVEYADGRQDVIVTDGSWKALADGPIRMSDMYQGESHDARKETPGWDAPGFADAAWLPATADPFGKPGGSWIDVTEQVRGAMRGSSLMVTASNQLAGDPVHGVRKHLRVTYRLGGDLKHAEVAENEPLAIRVNDTRLTIEKAEYGAAVPSRKIATVVRQGHPGSPVRRTQEIKPVALTEPKPGVWVFDMGQNFSGVARLKVRGPGGTKVVLRFAEMLNPDGTIYTANLRTAACTDTYVLRGGGQDEVWQPRFTFHGFRYVELTGLGGRPAPDTITGVALHSDARLTGAFECSNPMLNQLMRNIVWGQRSNYLEVPTDCPQRDERLGWSGDAQAFIGTATYGMDVAAFFTAWLRTYEDEQDPAGGFHDVAPTAGGVSPGWGDAGVVCPWTIYRVYGDRRLLEERYAGMARWIAWLDQRSKDGVRPAQGFGDWLSVGANTPKDVIATAWFAHSTGLLARAARALDKPGDAARYEQLADRVKAAFNRAFVAPDGRVKGHTQTAYLMALGYDLLPPEKRPAAIGHLVALIEQRNGHLSTGFLGVNLLLPVLTEAGRLDLAYRLLQNETYPSWGFPVKQGATTIWERWDGWTPQRGFQTPGMNSFNHYAYGACGEWMFSTMAGIDTDGPGFRRLILRPRPGGGLAFVKASYDSIHGRIAVSWRRQDGRFHLDVTIPANTSATVYVPAREAASVTESGAPAASARGVTFLRFADGAALYRVGSGDYRFASAAP